MPMAYLTLDETIARTPAEVFAYQVDFTQAPRWRRLVERMELVGGGPPAVGARVRVTYRVGGIEQVRDFIMTIYDPPRTLAWRREVGTHDWVVRYDVTADGTGSRVTLTLDAAAHRWLDRIRLWLFRRAQRRELASQLEALKRVLEEAPRQASRS